MIHPNIERTFSCTTLPLKLNRPHVGFKDTPLTGCVRIGDRAESADTVNAYSNRVS